MFAFWQMEIKVSTLLDLVDRFVCGLSASSLWSSWNHRTATVLLNELNTIKTLSIIHAGLGNEWKHIYIYNEITFTYISFKLWLCKNWFVSGQWGRRLFFKKWSNYNFPRNIKNMILHRKFTPTQEKIWSLKNLIMYQGCD